MGQRMIDLRSDTVTKPSAAMREAMAHAEVGDDVFGEDPTVNLLQEKVAALLDKEAALFVPSGTMGNQTCIKVHTQPGDEVLLEQQSHVYNNETGAMALLSSVQVNPIAGVRGSFTVEDLKKLIRPKVYYMPRSRLVCVENTHNRAGGTLFPLELIKEISAFVRNEGIRLHLDGARLWNASAATGIPPAVYASYFDSVSVCFSKGLGAPVGSAIVGRKEFIEEARHYRKIFGGGMRQAGILAAAVLYALEHHTERLVEDHEKARALARELSNVKGFDIDMDSVQTNIVIIDVERTGKNPGDILSLFRSRGVLLTPGNYRQIRAVTHMDVTADEVMDAARIIQDVMK